MEKQKPKIPNTEIFIDPNMLIEVVYNQIEFDLPVEIWFEIDEAFDNHWNTIPMGDDIYIDDIEKAISIHLKKKRIMLDYEKIKIIVMIMLNYIKDIDAVILD